jgi:CRP/FNR family transcriptional regulator, nitrogen oxide reductase regulator
MKRPSFTHSGLTLVGQSRSESDRIVSLEKFAGSRFLCGLSRADIEVVIGTAAVWQFSSNSVVVNQEDPANRLCFLVKGSGRYFIHTHGGHKLLLIWLTPGEIFGGSALLEQPSHYLCGVEVTRGTRILVWEREKIRDLSARYPRLLENALSIATDYLTWYVATHVALTCDSARQRVLQVLLNVARGIGEKVDAGISVAITNEELANTSNVTLFTVSRLMAEWERRGAIVKSRGRILIPRLQDLESAEEEKISPW